MKKRSIKSHTNLAGATAGVFCLALSAACSSQPTSKPKVLGGDDNFALGNPSPYSTVAVTDVGVDSVCSGTLISDDLVVTASHCFENITNVAQIRIFYGDNIFKAKPAEFHTAKDYRVFNPSGFSQALFPNYDVAWIRLADPIPAGHHPAEILRDATAVNSGDDLVLAGYGVTKDDCEWFPGIAPDCLGSRYEAAVQLYQYYNTADYHDLIVIHGKPEHGECHGDSGGPTFVDVGGKWYLTGVTNGLDAVLTPDAADGCESGEGVNTFVGAYASWIEQSSGETLSFGAGNPLTVAPLTPADVQASSTKRSDD